MKTAFMIFFANLTSIACVIGAIYLASLGIGGWGWFLFVAVLCVQSFSSGGEKNDY